MNLDLKRSKFNIVIGANYVNNYIEKIDKLSNLGVQYITILHDKDIDNCGMLKNPHYHLVVKLEERTRAKTFLNKLSNILQCDTVNIQIDECFDYIASIQYLLHLNNKDKYQYDINAITTNVDFELLESYLSSNVNIELTADLLIKFVESGYSKTEILKKIGLTKFNLYYKVIDYLIEHLRHDS